MKAFVPAAACALLLLLPACARLHRAGGAAVLAPVSADGEGGEVLQTGIASWYGADFQGRATSDGEIYDMNKLTAAHPELPFHTIVEVENLENGLRVRVRINDRGPFVKDRIIDLSLAAARRLNMADQGTARVNLRVVRWGGDMGGHGVSPVLARGGFVQAGAFSLRENAEELLQVLAGIFPGMDFRVAREEGLFKVISPRLEADACRDVLRQLAACRLPGFLRESDAPAGD